ncbi:MAG: hypothetical protein K6B41_02595 [Butyrivibrio sp.]|nr:hypothetical protein [Butyrivibrio sp.]
MKDINVLIRRYRDDIVICGRGIQVLGIWEILKIMILVFWDHSVDNILFDEVTDENEIIIFKTVVYITIILFCLFFSFWFIYIGQRAIKYGKGNSNKKYFLVVTAFCAVVIALGIPQYFTGEVRDISDTEFISVIVDITLTILMIQLIYSTIKVGSLEKKIRQV